MKSKELMIGDWIRFYLDADSGEPLIHNERVKNIYGDSINCEIRDNRIIRYKKLSYYEPIPLTAEILEKNGLDKVPELSLVLNSTTTPMLCSPMLHYVHELQHALRLCGLNDLADNFKL